MCDVFCQLGCIIIISASHNNIGMSQAKRTKMADAGASNIRVAIEFQYESLMNDKVSNSITST